jgi:hypothetical protein
VSCAPGISARQRYVAAQNRLWGARALATPPELTPPLISAQIKAARSLIRWTADNLAAASALSVATIRRAELKEIETALTTANDLAIRRAFERAGVEFIDENGGGPDVRLRKRPTKKSLPQPHPRAAAVIR